MRPRHLGGGRHQTVPHRSKTRIDFETIIINRVREDHHARTPPSKCKRHTSPSAESRCWCGSRRCDRSALYPQCGSRDHDDLEGADILAGGHRSQHLQDLGNTHQGKDRRRARVQAIRGQGNRRRFRADRRRQERRAGGDELLHALLGRQSSCDRVPVVLPDGPALSARMGRLLL